MRLSSVLIILFLAGCSTPGHWQRSVTLTEVKVTVVSDWTQYELEKQRRPDVLGYAVDQLELYNGLDEIWVLGTKTKDEKIVPTWEVLGHELGHRLHWADPAFKNPDE